MRLKVARMDREAEKYNAPATFMQYAKLSREARAVEEKLTAMQEARRARHLQNLLPGPLDRFIKFKTPLLLLTAYIVHRQRSSQTRESHTPFVPGHHLSTVATYPVSWFYPVSYPMSVRLDPLGREVGAISVTGWTLLCCMVVQRLLGPFAS